MASTEQEVIDIIVEQLGVDKDDVTPEKKLVEDLNADSLDLTELNMTFEERLGREIPPEEAENSRPLVTLFTILNAFQKSNSLNFRLCTCSCT